MSSLQYGKSVVFINKNLNCIATMVTIGIIVTFDIIPHY